MQGERFFTTYSPVGTVIANVKQFGDLVHGALGPWRWPQGIRGLLVTQERAARGGDAIAHGFQLVAAPLLVFVLHLSEPLEDGLHVLGPIRVGHGPLEAGQLQVQLLAPQLPHQPRLRCL